MIKQMDVQSKERNGLRALFLHRWVFEVDIRDLGIEHFQSKVGVACRLLYQVTT